MLPVISIFLPLSSDFFSSVPDQPGPQTRADVESEVTASGSAGSPKLQVSSGRRWWMDFDGFWNTLFEKRYKFRSYNCNDMCPYKFYAVDTHIILSWDSIEYNSILNFAEAAWSEWSLSKNFCRGASCFCLILRWEANITYLSMQWDRFWVNNCAVFSVLLPICVVKSYHCMSSLEDSVQFPRRDQLISWTVLVFVAQFGFWNPASYIYI